MVILLRMEFIKVHIRPVLPPKDDLYEVMDESLPPLSEGDDVLVSKKEAVSFKGASGRVVSGLF